MGASSWPNENSPSGQPPRKISVYCHRLGIGPVTAPSRRSTHNAALLRRYTRRRCILRTGASSEEALMWSGYPVMSSAI